MQNPKLTTSTVSIPTDLTIALLRQRDPHSPSDTRVLCLHGWLDNANSFVPMMPYLPDIDLVAVDLPGHGHSSHLQGPYSVLDTTVRCFDIADALQWDSFHVVGHSLGGSLALMMAVACPARILSTTAIESAGPLTERSEKFPTRLRKATDDRAHPHRYQSRTFDTEGAAVESRLKATKMDRLSAELIIRRQLQTVDSGFQWRFDPALRNASLSYLDESCIESAMASIECPTHAVVARDGFIAHRDESGTRLGQVKDLTRTELPGHHHLHMDTPEPVAASINRFLGTLPALGG